jgi:hypothetical protein
LQKKNEFPENKRRENNNYISSDVRWDLNMSFRRNLVRHYKNLRYNLSTFHKGLKFPARL